MAITSARDAVDTLGDRWSPDKVGDHSFVVQFVLDNPLPGDINRVHVIFDKGTPTILEGQHPSPELTIQVQAADFVAMTNGDFNMDRGAMTGKIKVSGKLG